MEKLQSFEMMHFTELLKGEPAKAKEYFGLAKYAELGPEILRAIANFCGRRFVLRRSTAAEGGDIDIIQLHTVISGCAVGFVGKAGFV